MKRLVQTLMVVPISETIAKAVGRNTMLGTGVAIVAARLVLGSFPGMLALGAVAGGINYLQRKRAGDTAVNTAAPRALNQART